MRQVPDFTRPRSGTDAQGRRPLTCPRCRLIRVSSRGQPWLGLVPLGLILTPCRHCNGPSLRFVATVNPKTYIRNTYILVPYEYEDCKSVRLFIVSIVVVLLLLLINASSRINA